MFQALSSEILSEGCLPSGSAVAAGTFFAYSRAESGAVVGPDALCRTMVDIDRLGREVPVTEDTPAPFARELAKRLLSEAQLLKPIVICAAVVEGSEGDVLIHWNAPSKGVVLICPGTAERPPQVYREVLSGNRTEHSSIGEASPETLSAALTWVLQAH